jgi:hypothetical protein
MTAPRPDSSEIRRIGGTGDAIPVDVLRDFLLVCLRHDALRDAVMERMAIQAGRDRLDPTGVALVLPTMMGELVATALPEDWHSIAVALIEAYRDARGEEV